MLKLKKLLCKTLTCFIFPEKLRKNVRNFMFYFSFEDYIRFKRQNFHIVSLGCDCLPRVLTTAIKLKPRKIYGEKTLPFDLCRSFDFERTAELIQNNFTDFFEDIKLTKELFPHDYKLTKEQFTIRYRKRISNFLELMGTWIKSFINDYGDIDDTYSRFCKNAGKKLKHIINYDT